MGKPKKGKKARQDDDFDDDNDTEFDPVAAAQAGDEIPVKNVGGKKGKKGKKKQDDWEDGVTGEIADLTLKDSEEEDSVNGQDSVPKLKKKEKKKNKKQVESEDEEDLEVSDEEFTIELKSNKQPSGVSAFAMLGMEDEGSDQDSESDEGGSTEEKSAQDQVKPQEQQKKGKKDKKKKENDDEDLDAIIAELDEAESKPVGKKDKKKKKQQAEDNEEEDIEALMAELRGETNVEEAPVSKKEKKKKKKHEEADYDVEPPGGIDFQDISQMTQEDLAKAIDVEEEEEEEEEDRKKSKKKKGKKGKAQQKEEEEDLDAILAELDGKPKEPNLNEEEEMEENDEEGGTVKTAAQKKKEKRERQKQKKLEEAKKGKGKKVESEAEVKEEEKEDEVSGASAGVDDSAQTKEGGDEEEKEDDSKKKKKKDKKKKKGEEEKEEKKKKPSKMAQAILEQQKKLREEEDRLRKEEEEQTRREEEARRLIEEKEAREKERREALKQKKKQKIEQQKAEGTYLTPKQREQHRRAQQMLEAMRAQGLEVPQTGETKEPEKKKRVVYAAKKKKPQLQKQESAETVEKDASQEVSEEPKDVEIKVEEKKEEVDVKDSWEEEDDVKDSWDAESEEEVDNGEKEAPQKGEERKDVKVKAAEDDGDEQSEEESDGEESEEESSEESSSEESSSEDDGLTAAERAREKAVTRIQKRKELAEKGKSLDRLRCPVVCVLGHVDTGKTKILDKLRRTNVQDGEAGGITQQIGATNVPHEAILEKTKMCKDFAKQELKLPGLLIIDTPGHESFSNLRSRGSSLCDIAILVVDIMHGLEPQTIESIGLLKKRKTPFLVALNKIDRLYGWQSNPHSDVVNTLKKQKQNTKQEFDERTTDIMVQFSEKGLNTCLFHENKNPKEYISLVPTSAHSGDGMGNLVALICELTQNHLAKKLAFSEELHATVMEVKAIQGLGTTIDVILVNGRVKEGQTIVVPGVEGPIVTQIRGLLMPEPMKELRVKSAYNHHKEVVAAQGVKMIAKDLDNAIAGLPLHIAYFPDEIDIYREELEEALEDVLKSIRVQEKGVFVQASTLGSLEALLTFLKDSKIPYSGINIGPVHRRDVMKASAMLEREEKYAVILAFDVKVEREAQEMAESLGIRVFTAEIIYHLFDQFTAYNEEYKRKKQEEFKHLAVFPCKVRVLPQYIFNSRDPIVCGVIVEAGFVKIGVPMCVPSKEFLHVGIVTSLELNHKSIEKATKGQEVCMKLDPIPGDSPKMFGRHFDEKDLLMSKISRESIDALKNYFRDEMSKADWQLIMEMKKTFEII